MRTLGVIALAIAIAGAAANWVPYHVDPDCTFDVQDACNRCPWDISWVQFVADGCNCNKFYQCQKRNGVITYTEFHCDPCMCFSNKVWSCSIKISDVNCPTNPPPTIVPIPTIQVFTNCFCVDFDGDAREHEKYEVDSSCQIHPTPEFVVDDYHTKINVLESHGLWCHVEIPYFQNNQFRTFSLCGMFNYFTGYPNTPMGLAYNGWSDDCAPGSIQLYKEADGSVTGKILTEANKWFTVNSGNVKTSAGTWYKTCLIYNGRGDQRTLTLTLDGADVGHNVFPITKRGLVGLTMLEHCNLRLGEGRDGNNSPFGFYGFLDTWCFSENLIRPSQCADGTFGVEGPIQIE